MINRLRVASQVPDANGISAGFVVKANRIMATIFSPLFGDGVRFVRAEQLKILTSAAIAAALNTALAGGKHYIVDTTDDVTVTLPAVTSANIGQRVRVSLKQLPGSGTGLKVSPNAVDKIFGNGFTPADDKDAILSAATDRVGDTIELESDGVDGWFITDLVGTWAREA
jgi:hypothetical protein